MHYYKPNLSRSLTLFSSPLSAAIYQDGLFRAKQFSKVGIINFNQVSGRQQWRATRCCPWRQWRTSRKSINGNTLPNDGNPKGNRCSFLQHFAGFRFFSFFLSFFRVCKWYQMPFVVVLAAAMAATVAMLFHRIPILWRGRCNLDLSNRKCELLLLESCRRLFTFRRDVKLTYCLPPKHLTKRSDVATRRTH